MWSERENKKLMGDDLDSGGILGGMTWAVSHPMLCRKIFSFPVLAF